MANFPTRPKQQVQEKPKTEEREYKYDIVGSVFASKFNEDQLVLRFNDETGLILMANKNYDPEAKKGRNTVMYYVKKKKAE